MDFDNPTQCQLIIVLQMVPILGMIAESGSDKGYIASMKMGLRNKSNLVRSLQSFLQLCGNFVETQQKILVYKYAMCPAQEPYNVYYNLMRSWRHQRETRIE